MRTGRESRLRVIESVFMLTSEGNRVFSLHSLGVVAHGEYTEALEQLIEEGVVSRINDKYLKVTVPRLQLLIMMGSESVISHVNDLSWSEFEEFISFIMRQEGYETLRGVRLTMGDVRGEFDVIGYRGNVVIIVEAKHWLSISGSELKAIVDKHVSKVKALADNWGKFIRKVKLNIVDASIYPLIVTLKAPQLQSYGNVPIIASHQLPSFLENMEYLRDNFLRFKARQATLGTG
ncbi:restriction endonuclease [Caldivirga sp. UBA161]|uniref:restriction endonuclease n=1 Tax=Caldivirga sp. UBA161 TaxID=1915569 RepID=UPI0025C3129D|nr:restriction endonuclease [Caldivirga sp. UBA161]